MIGWRADAAHPAGGFKRVWHLRIRKKVMAMQFFLSNLKVFQLGALWIGACAFALTRPCLGQRDLTLLMAEGIELLLW